MSTIKTVTLTGAAVAVIACGPILWQESQASRLRAELQSLETRRGSFESRSGRGGAPGDGAGSSGERSGTIRDLLSVVDGPIDVDRLMNDLTAAMASRDSLAMLRVFLPLANLDPDAHTRLLAEIKDHRAGTEIKETALQILASMAPVEHPRDSLERMMALDVAPSAWANLLSQWASEDPAAAYTWFREKRASGALAGTGVHATPDAVLLGQLVGGAARKDPDMALDILEATSDAESRMQMIMTLGHALGSHLEDTGDFVPLDRLLALDAGAENRWEIVESACRSVAEGGEFDAGLAVIRRYLDDPASRRSAIVNMLNNQPDVPVEQRGDWLVANLPEDELPAAVADFARRMGWEGQPDIASWLDAQPRGPARDRGLQSLSSAQAEAGSFAASLVTAQRIGDAGTRSLALAELAGSWLKRDPEAARRSLPADVVEQATVSGTH